MDLAQPWLEVERLHEYRLLDSPAEQEVQAVVRVAASVADVPTASLNLLCDDRLYEFSTVGFTGSVHARGDTLCGQTLGPGEFVQLTDAAADPRHRDDPAVRAGRIRFFAAAPLVMADGTVLGSLCVFDRVPHTLDARQVAALSDLAAVVVALFERRSEVRRNAELVAAADARQEWIELVLDSIDVAVLAVDVQGRFTRFNRAARQWHGLDVATGPEGVVAGLCAGAGDGMLVRAPDGEAIHVRADRRELRAADGSLLGTVVAQSQDTADLARRRLIEQARERFARANAELLRSNADLSNFAGAVSHDLAAPLAAVGGYLELLEDEMRGEAREWVAAAVAAVGRMRDLIHALLDHARAGNAPVQPVCVPLNDLLTEVLDDLRVEITAAGARVTVSGPLPMVDGDPVLLRQLLQNLITNAVRHRHPIRRCEVSVGAVGGAFRVVDNGLGIPADQREAVFGMFTRVDGRISAGHGVGLAICRRIVDRHGGDIRVEDSPGGGATVVFTLPDGQVSAAAADTR
ncbi:MULTISPECIES: ATP-binding protein [Actinoplanes]|uniref:sensor histidine kinase n=1 Tax=Actinoplanes TaxID=1865 RepID=UPI0005F27CC4|nr:MULTISPECIES: ATP-binding protein [Actinoplanes]GLY06668.1 hypothetical protein Acsp01_70470 [Actinoplanes sp. NBRC 101535]